MTLPDIIGYVGVGIILVTYALLQSGKMTADQPLYSAMNGLGAAGILVSLWFEPNFPSIVVEGAWLIISAFGLYRAILKQRT